MVVPSGWRFNGKTVGFVPTMGGLHEGHCSLIRRSLAENDVTVVSIFLNRNQFNSAGGFRILSCEFRTGSGSPSRLGCRCRLCSDYETMYPDNFTYVVKETSESKPMEGAERPGHFDGVLTIVLKLLNVVGPDRAYFGEKDYQQLRLVKGMVRAFFLPVEIVACETVRADDGLALSSRNRRLSRHARALSSKFPQILDTAEIAEKRYVSWKKRDSMLNT